MSRLSTLFSLLFIASCGAPPVPPADPLPAKDPPPAGALLGQTRRPLGEAVLLQGMAIEKYHKGYESDTLLQVQRIDGTATQVDLRMSLEPFFQSKSLDGFEKGKTYEVRGYEEGFSLGTPYWARKENGIIFQDVGFHFATRFIVLKCRKIPPVAFGAPDFVDRFCYLDGQTATIDGRAWITGPGWKIQAPGRETWPAAMEGKPVELEGVVRRGPGNDYHLDDGSARLLRLEDQAGSNVELRVTAWSLNDHWWVNFRGMKLMVENQEKLPGWNSDLHGRPVVISGLLEREGQQYIVRRASWREARRPELK